MTTTRATGIVVCVGVLLALVVAASLRAQSPQGFLLYTPAPGVPANYTPATALGFFLTMLALTVLSFMSAIVAGIMAWKVKGAWTTIAKAAVFSGLAFGLLLAAVSLTERLWP